LYALLNYLAKNIRTKPGAITPNKLVLIKNYLIMKNFNLFALSALFSLLLSSCSTNETLVPENQSLDLLKTYTINRDVNGAYSLDYSLNGNAEIENVIDTNTNTNNIYLYLTHNESSKNMTQGLTINGAQLKVGFVDTNSDISHNITIKDDNISLAKSNTNSRLSDYSITSNLDGTYTLDFSVNKKVRVDFVFNEEIETYEIHLEEGKTSDLNFSRVLEKEEEKALRIDFVNQVENTHARGEAISLIRKPRAIIL